MREFLALFTYETNISSIQSAHVNSIKMNELPKNKIMLQNHLSKNMIIRKKTHYLKIRRMIRYNTLDLRMAWWLALLFDDFRR